jgi:peptidoglycan/xylan/chitin deacetylase (PgdA/CDA1 family)
MPPKPGFVTRAARLLRSRGTQAWPGKMIKSRLDRPLASIVFDDFAQSSWTVGGRILEAAGARGTYFVSGSYCGREADGVKYFTPDDLAMAHANGHEIGCHTFDHRTVSDLPAAQIEASLERNREFVRRVLGDIIMTSFAYPHGETSIRTKRLLGGHFSACRGIFPGINKGTVDLSQLKGIELVPYILRNYPIDRMIEATIAGRGWLIFICHDVERQHSPWGCAPQVLEEAVSKLQAARIEILPVKNALGRVAFAH